MDTGTYLQTHTATGDYAVVVVVVVDFLFISFIYTHTHTERLNAFHRYLPIYWAPDELHLP